MRERVREAGSLTGDFISLAWDRRPKVITPEQKEAQRGKDRKDMGDLIGRVLSDPQFEEKMAFSLREMPGNTNAERVFSIWTPRSGSFGFGDAKPSFGPVHRTRSTALHALLDSKEFKSGVPVFVYVILRRVEKLSVVALPTKDDLKQHSIIIAQSPFFKDTILLIGEYELNNPQLNLSFFKEKQKLKDSIDKRDKREHFAHSFSKSMSEEEKRRKMREMEEYYHIQSHSIPTDNPALNEKQLQQIRKLA